MYKRQPFIKQIQAEIGKPKFSFPSMEVDHDLFEAIQNKSTEQVKFALDTDDKNVREVRLQPIKDAIHAEFDEQYPDKEMFIRDSLYLIACFVAFYALIRHKEKNCGKDKGRCV